MAMFNLRRFSNPDVLKTIDREHLLALLAPHEEYLSRRGVLLPPLHAANGIDYEGLAGVFMSPEADTPRDLANALYLVHEMATPGGMNDLLVEAESRGITFKGREATPADVAVQAWLQCPEVLETKHAEQRGLRRRSFEYYQTDRSPVPPFDEPSREALNDLEQDLDNWFEQKQRGRGSKVIVHSHNDEVWFFVRHGDPFKREGCLEDGRSSSVFYRPEKHDLLIYDPALGEIRINARTKAERDIYRRKFGHHIFGDEAFFPGEGKYSLRPLIRDGEASMVCTDVEGMEWVKLKEVHYYWAGPMHEVEIRKADDMFAALAMHRRVIPPQARIMAATFQVKFADSRSARIVTIKPSNIAQYTRDDDSAIIEDWLDKRGFIDAEGVYGNVEAPALVAVS